MQACSTKGFLALAQCVAKSVYVPQWSVRSRAALVLATSSVRKLRTRKFFALMHSGEFIARTDAHGRMHGIPDIRDSSGPASLPAPGQTRRG